MVLFNVSPRTRTPSRRKFISLNHILESGKNPYDVRRTCNPQEDTSLCYKQMGWIETWMNDEENKKAVGANPAVDFESCNMQINQAFTMQGDSMHNSALLLTDLVNDGVRLLIYAGNADYMVRLSVHIIRSLLCKLTSHLRLQCNFIVRPFIPLYN